MTASGAAMITGPEEIPEAEEARWLPDDLLVPAVLAGSRTTMGDLGLADRAWLVVNLRLAGHTAEAIADRLDCSLRRVRSISADDLGQVMKAYILQRDVFDMEHRMAASEVRRLAGELGETEAARDRYKAQLDRMLDRLIIGEGGPPFRCGHPRTRYNTYEAPKTGKANCRTCHAEAARDYRARCRARAQNGDHEQARVG